MGFLDTAHIMVALALPMCVGYIARRLNFMNDALDAGLSRLVIWVTLPCMLLSSVGAKGLPTAQDIYILLALSSLAYIVVTTLAALFSRLLRDTQNSGIYAFIVAFGNVGFIGYPVLSALFGPEAVLLAAIANIPYNVLVFSVGVVMVESASHNELRSILKNCAKSLMTPVVIVSVIVLIMVLLGINSLGILGEGLGYAGNLTVPAALLLIGSSLAKQHVSDMKETLSSWRLWLSMALRLIVVPLVVFVVVTPFVTSSLLVGVLVIGQAMPVATNGILYCLNAGRNTRLMATGTLISVVASIASIPLLATLLHLVS